MVLALESVECPEILELMTCCDTDCSEVVGSSAKAYGGVVSADVVALFVFPAVNEFMTVEKCSSNVVEKCVTVVHVVSSTELDDPAPSDVGLII